LEKKLALWLKNDRNIGFPKNRQFFHTKNAENRKKQHGRFVKYTRRVVQCNLFQTFVKVYRMACF
jgi:hypothetical protein